MQALAVHLRKCLIVLMSTNCPCCCLLLVVFLTKIGQVGGNDVQQFQHDGRDATKVTGTRSLMTLIPFGP